MAKTVPGRRVVVAAHDMLDPIGKKLAEDQRLPDPIRAGDMDRPPGTYDTSVVVELTYEQRIQRQIDMLNHAMAPYEKVLSGGGVITVEAEKRLMLLMDGARKLELALSQIRAKDDGHADDSELDLALGMAELGMPFDVIVANFKHNPKLPQQLQEALDAQE
jgi:hypothetical protein